MDMGMHMNHTMDAGAGAGAMPPMSMAPHRHMMMHMTFFWGKNTEILFQGWPGYDHLGMYLLALVFVFALAMTVEWISASKFIRENSDHVSAGIAQTAMYTVRMGLAYLVMLSVMSFNAGVFLVAIAGHAVGFFFFASRVFHDSPMAHWKTSDLPPAMC